MRVVLVWILVLEVLVVWVVPEVVEARVLVLVVLAVQERVTVLPMSLTQDRELLGVQLLAQKVDSSQVDWEIHQRMVAKGTYRHHHRVSLNLVRTSHPCHKKYLVVQVLEGVVGFPYLD